MMLKVGVSWTGEIIKISNVNLKVFDEFLNQLSDLLKVSGETLVILSEEGDEVDGQNFEEFLPKLSLVYCFSLEKLDTEMNLPKFLDCQVCDEMEQFGTLPTGGNSSLTMDEQTNLLKMRLERVKNHILVLLDRQTFLLNLLSSCESFERTISGSLHSVEVNSRNHKRIISNDIVHILENSRSVITRVNALINRCPIDFALMKRIPLSLKVFKREEDESPATLIDVAGQTWQQQYIDCTSIRDDAYQLVQKLEIVYNEILKDTTTTTTTTTTKITYAHERGEGMRRSHRHRLLVWPELEFDPSNLELSLSEISNALNYKDSDESLSDNLSLVHKSSKILNLAEVASRYGESYLSEERTEILNQLRSRIIELKLLLVGIFSDYHKEVITIATQQANLAQALNDCAALSVMLNNLNDHCGRLEAIHALPIAYVALVCELSRRTSFTKSLKSSFCKIEGHLEGILREESTRRQQFQSEIMKIMDLTVLNERVLSNDVSGNVVLFLSEDNNVDLNDLNQLEEKIRIEEESLPDEDPIRPQLQKFIDTVVQMKKRANPNYSFQGAFTTTTTAPPLKKFLPVQPTIMTDDNLGESQLPSRDLQGNFSPPKQGKNLQSLVIAYEDRIKKLERLLHENYVALKGAKFPRVIESTDFDQEKLTKSIMHLTTTTTDEKAVDPGRRNDDDWKDVIGRVFDKIGIVNNSGGGGAGKPPPLSPENFEVTLLEYLGGREKFLKKVQDEASKKVTIRNFSIGDIALFLPTIRKGVWSLFNYGCPNYYLCPESMNNLLASSSSSSSSSSLPLEEQSWLLGRISRIEKRTSTGKSFNPFRLPKGFEYQEVTAERVIF